MKLLLLCTLWYTEGFHGRTRLICTLLLLWHFQKQENVVTFTDSEIRFERKHSKSLSGLDFQNNQPPSPDIFQINPLQFFIYTRYMLILLLILFHVKFTGCCGWLDWELHYRQRKWNGWSYTVFCPMLWLQRFVLI